MKTEFYDVKARQKLTADVLEKVTYGEAGRKRFAFKAQTADGRTLMKFTGEAAWNACDAPVGK